MRLSRGLVLRGEATLEVMSSAGKPTDGSVEAASSTGHGQIEINWGVTAEGSELSLWTGSGGEATWLEMPNGNDWTGAPPALRAALIALSGRPMTCRVRRGPEPRYEMDPDARSPSAKPTPPESLHLIAPVIAVAARGFGQIEVRIRWADASHVSFALPVRFAVDGEALKGWRMFGRSFVARRRHHRLRAWRHAATASRSPRWASFEVTSD